MDYAKLGKTVGVTLARNFALNANWDLDAATWQNVDLTLADASLGCPVCMGDIHRCGAEASVTADGQIYHKRCITQWFEQRKSQRLPLTSPATNLELPSAFLVPLTFMTHAIEVYIRERPEFRSKHIALLDLEQTATLLQAELFCVREGNARLAAMQACDRRTPSQRDSARAEGATAGAAEGHLKQFVELRDMLCWVSGKALTNISIHTCITTFVAMISSSEYWSLKRIFAFVCVELTLLIILYLHLQAPRFIEVAYNVCIVTPASEIRRLVNACHLYSKRTFCQALERLKHRVCFRSLKAALDLALNTPFSEVRRLVKTWYLYVKLNAALDFLNAGLAMVVRQTLDLVKKVRELTATVCVVQERSREESEEERSNRLEARRLEHEARERRLLQAQRECVERGREWERPVERQRIERERAVERRRQREFCELRCAQFIATMRNGDVLGVRDAIVNAKTSGVAPTALFSGFKKAELERLKI